VRQGGDAHAEHEGHITYAKLDFGDGEQVEDPGARRIGQGGKEVSYCPGAAATEAAAEDRADGVGVKTVDVASISIDLGGKYLSHCSSIARRAGRDVSLRLADDLDIHPEVGPSSVRGNDSASFENDGGRDDEGIRETETSPVSGAELGGSPGDLPGGGLNRRRKGLEEVVDGIAARCALP
jgi:hypothetical protein